MPRSKSRSKSRRRCSRGVRKSGPRLKSGPSKGLFKCKRKPGPKRSRSGPKRSRSGPKRSRSPRICENGRKHSGTRLKSGPNSGNYKCYQSYSSSKRGRMMITNNIIDFFNEYGYAEPEEIKYLFSILTEMKGTEDYYNMIKDAYDVINISPPTPSGSPPPTPSI